MVDEEKRRNEEKTKEKEGQKNIIGKIKITIKTG